MELSNNSKMYGIVGSIEQRIANNLKLIAEATKCIQRNPKANKDDFLQQAWVKDKIFEIENNGFKREIAAPELQNVTYDVIPADQTADLHLVAKSMIASIKV